MSTEYVSSTYHMTDVCKSADADRLDSKAYIDNPRDLVFIHGAHSLVFLDWYKNTKLHRHNVENLLSAYNQLEMVGNYVYKIDPYNRKDAVRLLVSNISRCRKKKTFSIMCAVDLSSKVYKHGQKFELAKLLDVEKPLVNATNISFVTAVHNAIVRLKKSGEHTAFTIYDESKEVVANIRFDHLYEPQILEILLDIICFIKLL